MAQKISTWMIFLRAFMISLLATQPAKLVHAQSSDESAWRSAVAANTEQAYHDYLNAHPAGNYVRDAILALQRLLRLRGGPTTRDVGSVTGSGGGNSGDLY